MPELIDRWAGGLARLLALVGTAGLIIEVAVVLVDVVGRAFGHPLTGAQDITSMGLVAIVFGGMALCDRQGGHIAVDIFERSFPGPVNRACDIVAALMGAAIFVFIAWSMWDSAALSRMLNLSTNILNLPKAWFQYFIIVAALITAFGMLLRALTLIAAPPRQANHAGQDGRTE